MSRVLVVEDEFLVAKSIAALLAKHGHEVPACLATGADAVAATLASNPDVVLVDIQLQGPMDGIEAARQIREQRDIPIVFLTAYSDNEHLERAKATGPYAYLLKPYTDRELLTTIDIVLHKHRLELELRERERWLGTALQSLGDGVIAVGPDQGIRFLNRTAEQLTGWTSEAASGRPLDEVLRLIDVNTREPCGVPIEDAIREGNVRTNAGCSVLVANDGREIVVESSVAAITENGIMLGGVVVFRDVSARRELDARLATAARMTALSTLTAGLSHELNNPLTATLANIDLLLSLWVPRLERRLDTIADGPALEILGAIKDRLVDALAGSERMRGVIATVRAFARPSGVPDQPVDLVQAIETAIVTANTEISGRAELVREFHARPTVLGNPGQLGQVFANLLVNAAQAIPEGSAERTIRVLVEESNARAVVEVTDTGIGIPPEVMVRIFEPFFTTKPIMYGAGLGLAIAHSLVEAHHGAISASSKVGTGTTFRVILPCATAET